MSKGMLPAAKRKALKLVKTLEPYKDLPIIGLEPSCTLTIRDDYPSLDPSTAEIANRIVTFQEFVTQRKEQLPLHTHKQHYKIHGHCYEKAIMGMEETSALFNFLPGATHEVVPSGCCGMAGSFGYEAEHYVFSLRIGETTLFPHLRDLPSATQVITNGTSCRQQIHHTLGIHPLHTAEALAAHLV
jgi:Fe-S oxidoreductase